MAKSGHEAVPGNSIMEVPCGC